MPTKWQPLTTWGDLQKRSREWGLTFDSLLEKLMDVPTTARIEAQPKLLLLAVIHFRPIQKGADFQNASVPHDMDTKYWYLQNGAGICPLNQTYLGILRPMDHIQPFGSLCLVHKLNTNKCTSYTQYNCTAFILKATFYFQFTYVQACVPTDLHSPVGSALHNSPSFLMWPLGKIDCPLNPNARVPSNTVNS